MSQKTASEVNILPTQQLILLVDPDNAHVKFLNDVGERYCGMDLSALQKKELCFYKEFVHPEDYNGYLKHLKQINSEEDTIYPLRLKGKNDKWETFIFKDRLYQPQTEKKQQVLSLASPAGDNSKEESQNPCYNSLQTEYEHLINSLHDGFAIVEMIYDKDGIPLDYFYLKTNPAFQKHVDFKNVTGKTVRELVKQPNEKWLNAFAKVAETGEPVRFKEYNANLGDTWLDLYAFKVGEKDSRRIGILFRNITGEKKQEEELQNRLERHHKDLQESRDLLQSVFDTTNLAIAVLRAIYDEEGRIKDFIFLRTNKVLQEMYLQEEIIGRTYLETTKHGVEMGTFDAYKQVMTTGEPLDDEVYFDKEGYNHWFRLTARAQNDLLIATIEDISQRKAEAKELEETMRFKQELVRATPEVIMIINLNSYTIRYMNKDLAPEAGLIKDNVVGRELQQVLPYIHPRDREKIMQFHRNLLKSSAEDIIEEEIRLKLKGSAWEWFNLRGKIFKRRDAAWVDEYVLLIRNIHEQKYTQKALLKAEKLSIQGEIARTFAHELRNPLASIGMVGEVLSRKLKDSVGENYSNYFKILKRSTKTLNDLVNNLLNASNYSPAVLKEEDLAIMMDNTIHKAADRIYLSGIKVEKNYKGKFPVLADKEKLEIALLNLIVNASEATTPEEGRIEIEIKKHKTDFMLRISDNGQGMTQDQIDHIFEAFYSNKETGMGIGMSSVKSILEEHDAPIKVSSRLNEGTTFIIYFPNAEVH
ncbi:ATP-binding protein [Salinimicrobium catena]|uniref:ATP-binding protein n=1 Tax=Salinimicrobium catena TaxID=390640 RepID=UPI002FE4F1F2